MNEWVIRYRQTHIDNGNDDYSDSANVISRRILRPAHGRSQRFGEFIIILYFSIFDTFYIPIWWPSVLRQIDACTLYRCRRRRPTHFASDICKCGDFSEMERERARFPVA